MAGGSNVGFSSNPSEALLRRASLAHPAYVVFSLAFKSIPAYTGFVPGGHTKSQPPFNVNEALYLLKNQNRLDCLPQPVAQLVSAVIPPIYACKETIILN